MENTEVEPKTKCQVCVSGCKQLATFTLSHVGLLTLVICYCLIGAAMFEALESDHERLVKKNMTVMRSILARDLWNMTQRMLYLERSSWSNNASEKLRAYESDLLRAIKRDGWDGTEDPETLQWNILGALFYSIIVITTIGYGHIAPKTMWGKIMTIFYAIVGIPLMVVCWSHIGDFMANSFRVIYWKACCYICTRTTPAERVNSGMRGTSTRRSVRSRPNTGTSIRMKNRSIRRSARTSQRSADSAISADSIHSIVSDPGIHHTGGSMRIPQQHRSTMVLGQPPQRSHPHYSTLPRTTQPKSNAGYPSRYQQRTGNEPDFYKPISPAAKNLPVLFNPYAEDVPTHQGFLHTVEYEGNEEEYEEAEIQQPQRSKSRRTFHDSGQHSQRYVPAPEELEYWDEEEEEEIEIDEFESENFERRPVPIWLCAFLVISYIIGGAFLFSNWEGWKILDAAYFCFITLTTIGFGDFVPAKRLTTSPEVSITLCSVYLLFGIALLAMSFNLVQEQVINAFKDLAMRLGIISEEDER